MAARKKGWLRHPRTTQERRCNQGKNNKLVRSKRRSKNLVNTYDDIFVPRVKSWKKLRKQQYREENNYSWHEFSYDIHCSWHRTFRNKILKELERLGCYFEYIGYGIRWFGPDIC